MNQLITILLILMLGFSMPCLAQNGEHVVKVGEDFASIAQKYGITEQQLIDANPKSRGICYVGLKLSIPLKQDKPATTTQTPEPAKPVEPTQTTAPKQTTTPKQTAQAKQPVESLPTVQPKRSDNTYTSRKTPTYKNHPRNVEISSDSDYKPINRGLMSFGRSNFSISGRYEEFLNSVFYQHSHHKDIKSQIGIEGSYSLVLFSPLALEVTGFYTTYNVEPLAKSGEKTKVAHAGIECFADAYFLPYVGKLSNYFAPYAGIGYQTSSLTWGDDISAGTGSAMIKCGAKIGLGWGIHLRLEYKQTLPKNSKKLFFACAIGLGCKL